MQYLSILENEEPHVSAMMDVIFLEEGRSVVLYPHTRQLIVVDVVTLKSTLCTCNIEWMCNYRVM